MKKLLNFQNLLSAIIIMVMVIAVNSCSQKDDDELYNPLVGTWTVVSIDGEPIDGESYEFKADGSFIWIDCYTGHIEMTDNHKYLISGNILRMDYNINDGEVDDYTIGEFSIKGNTLTYTRTWHDGVGKWDSDEIEIIVMRRK